LHVGSAVVALSGGLASALAAYLLTTVYEENCVACIATAADGTDQRVERARFVADWLGELQYPVSDIGLRRSASLTLRKIDLFQLLEANLACARLVFRRSVWKWKGQLAEGPKRSKR
jgi:NH3-dependent NAD+ synthetase